MRRTTIALSAVALAATLGACGQDSTTGSGEGGQSGSESGAPFANVASLVNGAGSSMQDKQTVTMTTEVSGGGAAQSGMGNMKCQIDIQKTMMSCNGSGMEMVTTPDAMYMKSPELAGMGGDPSKPWMKISANSNDPMGKMLSQSASSMQKLTDFKAMLPPGTSIVNNTQDQIDGKDATRYETVTNVNKAAAEAPQEMRGIYKMLTDSGISEIKQTVWVDSDGLPIKVTSKQPPMKMMGQQIPEQTTTVNYSDWGKPVNVTVPPQPQVQDMKMPQLPNTPN